MKKIALLLLLSILALPSVGWGQLFTLDLLDENARNLMGFNSEGGTQLVAE